MNIEKTELKILIATDIGASLEDRLEGEVKATHELSGASMALRQAAKKVPNDLVARVESDENIKDGMEEHLIRKVVKEYLARVGDYLMHLSDVEQQKAITQGGRVDGIRTAMDIVKKMRDTEVSRAQAAIALASSNAKGEPVRTAAEAARKENGTVAERREAEKKKPARKKATRKKSTTKKA